MAARKLKLSKSTVTNIKVNTLGIKARTQKKVPKYSEGQEQTAKTGLRKIYKKVLEKVLIIDDESYVHHDPSQVPGRKFYHAANPGDVDYTKKFKVTQKFPKKHLVWQALDDFRNISDAFITTSNMNAETYLNELSGYGYDPLYISITN